MKRKIFQILFALIPNSYLKGFAQGKIYKGNLKYICAPGLNCYSCPGALVSCPIGSLQAILSDIRYQFSFYVFGILILFGTIFGRWICGWLCPFGLIQELLHKIPSPKLKILHHFWLKYLKYAILILFAIALPMFWVNEIGLGSPAFCKYICPAGTLEAGIPLVLSNPYLKNSIGLLFYWKIALLAATVLLSILLFRPFCRFLCPLGAIYGLFNWISACRLQLDKNQCIKCGRCRQKCKLDIPVYQKPNSPECIRCGECIESCPKGAIESRFPFWDSEKKRSSYPQFYDH
ncbi:MAG TPA: 4Fe-4S binding protein [Clostridiales bacterium]|nr:4Fe-4S binding protein [Clostridiales bacterium]